MFSEHGFARIIIIYVFNKEWQCFQICQYLLKMADILFVTMETGVWLTKVQYIFYSVRPILYFWQKNCKICTNKKIILFICRVWP